jgi:hypothetical protein
MYHKSPKLCNCECGCQEPIENEMEACCDSCNDLCNTPEEWEECNDDCESCDETECKKSNETPQEKRKRHFQEAALDPKQKSL